MTLNAMYVLMHIHSIQCHRSQFKLLRCNNNYYNLYVTTPIIIIIVDKFNYLMTLLSLPSVSDE